MAAMSDYLEKAIADHILGGGDFLRPATVYVALYTAAPSDSGGGTEVTGGSYSRVAVTNNSTNWPGATSGAGTKANGTAITFPTATAAWGTVVAFGIFDAASGGNLLFQGSLVASKVVDTSDTPSFGVGAFILTFQ